MRANSDEGKARRSRDRGKRASSNADSPLWAGGKSGATRKDAARLDGGAKDTAAAPLFEISIGCHRVERVMVGPSGGRRARSGAAGRDGTRDTGAGVEGGTVLVGGGPELLSSTGAC